LKKNSSQFRICNQKIDKEKIRPNTEENEISFDKEIIIDLDNYKDENPEDTLLVNTIFSKNKHKRFKSSVLYPINEDNLNLNMNNKHKFIEARKELNQNNLIDDTVLFEEFEKNHFDINEFKGNEGYKLTWKKTHKKCVIF